MSKTHYNLDYLQQVFQGNEAMVQRILDVFEEQVPGYFVEMNERWSSGQWRDLHPLAHKAKSSLGMLGMTGVLEHVLYIEEVSRRGEQPDQIEARLTAAKVALEAAMAALAQDRRQSLDGTSLQAKRPHRSEGMTRRGGGLLRA